MPLITASFTPWLLLMVNIDFGRSPFELSTWSRYSLVPEPFSLVTHASLCIAAPNQHPLAGRKEISISDLQNEAWVTREKGSGTREYLDHVLSSNGLRPKSMFTISMLIWSGNAHFILHERFNFQLILVCMSFNQPDISLKHPHTLADLLCIANHDI